MAASPAPLPVQLPDESCLKLEQVDRDGSVIVIQASAIAEAAGCPACGIYSEHVHSRYCRTLRDLPSQGLMVRIRLRTRRFYCLCQGCRRRIFTERFPTLTQPHGRQTQRHRNILKLIGYSLGGEAGFRLANQLGVAGSADSILRTVKQPVTQEADRTPRLLGVDDWAWRKGHRYGTVLVDLERRRPIDLLPDRESQTLVKWLHAHPGVEIVSRDRAGAYADAARKGAPQALQVADRFHVLCNLTQALQRLLERFAGSLQRLRISEPTACQDALTFTEKAELCGDKVPAAGPPLPGANPTYLQRRSEQDREERKSRYDAVKAAYQDGLTKSAIARQLGLTRTTVRRLLHAEDFLERAPRQRRSALKPFEEYLRKRWAEGCHNASQLCRELRKQGYTGQRSRVKEYLHPWRTEKTHTAARRRKLPNLRLVSFWLSKPMQLRSADEQQWVREITAAHPVIATAESLALQFRDLVKNKDSEALDGWLQASENAHLPELKRFATGIRRDYDAVIAGIQNHWSNGQVEGQVHRLKLLKRQMYGRAGFPLLRMRVLSFNQCEPSLRASITLTLHQKCGRAG